MATVNDTSSDPAALLADIQALAVRRGDGEIGDAEVEIDLGAIAKRHRASIAIVRSAFRAEMKKYKAPPRQPKDDGRTPDREALKAQHDAAFDQCRDIATDRVPAELLFGVVERLGVVGDRRGVLAAYLVGTSRLLSQPCAFLKKGSPSSGKSYGIEKGVLPLFNEDEDYVKLTSASAKALFYSDIDFRHKLIFVPEAAALAQTRGGGNDELAMATRELISSGELNYHTVEKGPDGKLRGARIRKEGPIAFIVTTARENIEEELATRLLVGLSDERDAQTERILQAHARRAAGEGPEPVSGEELARWRAFQTWLRLGPRDVVIPFATCIAEHTNRRLMRIRRDLPGLLALVKASALLHRYHRRTDEQGRIVADVWDYGLAVRALGEGLEELAHGETATIDSVRAAVCKALRTERERWRRALFMGGFVEALLRHLSSTGQTQVIDQFRNRAAGCIETVDQCLTVAASAGARQVNRGKLYRAAVEKSCKKARELGKRPDHVELSTYKLADLLGISRGATRVRLENAIEAGAVRVVDNYDPARPRPRTAPKLLAPGAPVNPKSASGRTGAFPPVALVQREFLKFSASSPTPSGPSGLV